MKLTPLDIRKQEFDRSLRGYDPDEVEAFLEMVANQWEEVAEERRRLEKKVEELEGQMEHYRKVEEALQRALDQTRENAEQKLDNARQKAENIVEEARSEANETKRKAEAERDRLMEETHRLRSRRNELIARLRGFLNSELEILEEYDREETVPEPSIESMPERSPESSEGSGHGGEELPSEPVASSGPGGHSKEPAAPDVSGADEEETFSGNAEDGIGEAEDMTGTPASGKAEDDGDKETGRRGSFEFEDVEPSAASEDDEASGEDLDNSSDAVSETAESESESPPPTSKPPERDSSEQEPIGTEPSFDGQEEQREAGFGQPSEPAAEETDEEDSDTEGQDEPEDEFRESSDSKKNRDTTSDEIEKIWSILEDME